MNTKRPENEGEKSIRGLLNPNTIIGGISLFLILTVGNLADHRSIAPWKTPNLPNPTPSGETDGISGLPRLKVFLKDTQGNVSEFGWTSCCTTKGWEDFDGNGTKILIGQWSPSNKIH